MDSCMARAMASIPDVAAYILDPIPNCTKDMCDTLTYGFVNILRTLDDYEVCLETVKDGCCEDSEVLNSFRCVQFHNMNEQVARSWALWFINKDRQKLLPEIEENKTVCIRRYQFQVDDASYTINYHLVDVEDVLEELKLRKEEANG